MLQSLHMTEAQAETPRGSVLPCDLGAFDATKQISSWANRGRWAS